MVYICKLLNCVKKKLATIIAKHLLLTFIEVVETVIIDLVLLVAESCGLEIYREVRRKSLCDMLTMDPVTFMVYIQ